MYGRSALLILSALLSGCALEMQPLTTEQNTTFVADTIPDTTADQEPVAGPVDLYEAMARALKYNLDSRVEIMEAALKVKEFRLASYNMLPQLVASSGYDGRNNADPSSPSTADPDVFTSDLTFSWNILDFGLSYVRAKQAADEALIQEENKRKVINRVIEDVRTSYWRAVSYQRLVGRMRALERKVAGALRDTRQLASGGESSPLEALTYERELIEIQREVETLEGELMVAKRQLAALMNLRPGTEFTLSVAKRGAAKLRLPGKPQELFQLALEHRPEMREIQYQMRINDKEVLAALLQLLPDLNIYAGVNYDSNEFLVTNDWISWGSKVTWNLLKIATIPATKKRIEAQQAALDARALSIAMAVMTQIEISRLRFEHRRKSYNTASALSNVSQRILNQVRTETAEERTSQQILVREEMNSLLADAKRDREYADLQNAYANVYASLGLDPFPAGLDTADTVDNVAERLRQMWIERGEQPAVKLAQAN